MGPAGAKNESYSRDRTRVGHPGIEGNQRQSSSRGQTLGHHPRDAPETTREIRDPAGVEYQMTALKALSLAGYLGMMGGLLILIFVRGIFSPSPIIIVLQIAAVLLFLWARI